MSARAEISREGRFVWRVTITDEAHYPWTMANWACITQRGAKRSARRCVQRLNRNAAYAAQPPIVITGDPS